MADFDNRVLGGTGAVAASFDAGLRAYMVRVFNYMFIGLALTGLLAYGTYAASVTSDAAAAAYTFPNGLMLTQTGVTLFASPLRWVVMLAPLGMVLWLSFGINRMSAATAQISFWIYAGLMGVSLGSIFMVYTMTSIAQVFFITAATFGSMALYGYTTKRDLTGMGSFLFMGLIGIVIASLVSMFFHSAMLTWVISVAGVLIFTGLTAYDAQSIKNMYSANADGTVTGRMAILGALRLYLDFINLFLSLLRLFGDRR